MMGLFFSWLLLFCLLPGIISALILEGKGGNGFVGFILGFLFSYIGLIITLLMPNNPEQIKAREETAGLYNGTMKKCPYCKENIKAEAIKCRYCGETL